MSWSNAFIGIPWVRLGRARAGIDCWGVVVMTYRDVLGIELPDYLDVPVETAEMARQVDAIAAGDPWHAVAEPREFDVAVFRMGAILRHVGVVAGPGLMLHVTEGGTSCIASIDAPRWRPRLIGYCRHETLMGAR
ncbi:cell wall-associated NlpC family hydrolase [Ancylobacter sp. 3268]|uniref:C40 family peptidase n=1 Tax=Ancylobacter sp. 3268 TaxID=2817752 RepID=UPI002855A984|nr:NlpC/P60 family protein [Ancylobacter sp. 3268]MDR6953778.1 cell wall-associated NlpC family hydrolase [Ancylobacter sp. 3268]